MQAGARQVLLLSKKGASRATQSPHDGDGELYVAFAIPANPARNTRSSGFVTRTVLHFSFDASGIPGQRMRVSVPIFGLRDLPY
jgi:hypothetical protein